MRENECLTVFIVDDEAGAREVLARDLRKFPQITQIYCFNNYDECTLPLLQLHPDVLFLDVQVPGCTGLEFLESVRTRLTFNFKVVFYTGYADYMLQAIRLSAFDYLLKPYKPSELNTIIERIFNSDDYDIRHHPLVHPTSVRKVAVQTITELLFLTMEQIVMLSYMTNVRGNSCWPTGRNICCAKAAPPTTCWLSTPRSCGSAAKASSTPPTYPPSKTPHSAAACVLPSTKSTFR